MPQSAGNADGRAAGWRRWDCMVRVESGDQRHSKKEEQARETFGPAPLVPERQHRYRCDRRNRKSWLFQGAGISPPSQFRDGAVPDRLKSRPTPRAHQGPNSVSRLEEVKAASRPRVAPNGRWRFFTIVRKNSHDSDRRKGISLCQSKGCTTGRRNGRCVSSIARAGRSIRGCPPSPTRRSNPASAGAGR